MKLFLPSLLLFVLINVVFLLQLGSCYDPIGYSCDTGSSTPSQSAINRVFSQLVAKAPSNNFATASYGSGSSAVYGLLQCRGDVPSSVCAQCARDAAAQAKALCGTVGQARVWFDFCYIRYDTTSFFGQIDTGYSVQYVNGDSLPDAKLFRKKEENLMRKVSSMAVVPGGRAIGTAQTQYNSTVTIYGLAQCTRDLEPVLCAKCLATAISNFPTCCDGRQGGQVSYGSCVARYEIYPFYYPLIGNSASSSYSTTDHLKSGRVVRYDP
ncbi:cysteine-rich repeat secretory protein 55-like [Nymphaea colorata]|uniref:cysteine-rich repeat secretory protein 55-like n=1 Tax=Nymphaea colorata TaxID=210225 RepID=UPI00129DDF12|nr:cysteine-rich repeat secretory protein 55-like [Nymphaea colorata]